MIAADPETPWVRAAHPADAEPMGDLHVRAWRAGYAQLMPQPYLDALDAGERRAFWRRALSEPPPGVRMMVACLGAAVVGFTVCGPEEFAEATGRGQVYALNVDPAFWRQGAGSALLVSAQEQLAADGYTEAVLWVLPGNARARLFYERHGWRSQSLERPSEVFGVTVTELQYVREF